jgi:hypothetical protein
MSIFKDKKFKGQFPGNYSGNLWQTFNIDLEREQGRIVLSDKMRRLTSGLGVVTKFIRTNATGTDQWFGLTVSDILRNGNSLIISGTWISDDTTGTFNDPLDAVIHEAANGEERLIVTRPTDIAILNRSGSANVWDSDWGSTVPSVPIPTTSLTYRPIARLERLVAVANKVNDIAKIDTIDKNDVVTLGAITFPAGYTVKNIYTSSNRFWIGLINDRGGNAKVVEWDGTSETYNNAYDLIGAIPLVGWVKDDIPYFITEKGIIFRYTGGGFREVQNFGLEDERLVFTTGDIGDYGAYVDGDIVYLNINSPTVQSFTSTVLYRGSRRLRSGIWVFNTANRNLYHHMAIGEHASAGTDVNYGCSPLAGAGAVIKQNDVRYLHASASVYTGGATWQAGSTSGIYLSIPTNEQTTNAGRNRGYFITPYIPLSEIEGMWEAFVVKFKKFVNSNNRIIVKWRVTEPLFNASAQDQGGNAFEGSINAPITWVNTTSFTCKVPTGVSVGDEVEILSGDNAGCSFAISNLSATSDNSTTITVTIAEAAPTSSTDTALVRFDNWKTETAISSTTVGNQRVPFTATAHGEFIQLKVEMRGFDVQIDDIEPIFKSKTSPRQS